MSENKPMSNFIFRIMTIELKLINLFHPIDKRLEDFNIKEGSTVVDYGCGPGIFIKKASKLVDKHGKVIAVDIHPLAMKKVKKICKKNNLENVETYLAEGFSTNIPNSIADMVYIIDMFHFHDAPKDLLKEVHRITKDDGQLIVEDSHSHMSKPKIKYRIENSGVWKIKEEKEKFFVCKKS